MTKINEKAEWAVQKHAAQLGAHFARCAGCHGTSGKVEEDGKMRCSRIGPRGAFVSAAQAQRCDGSRPVVVEDQWPLKTATTFIGQQLSAA